MPADVDRPVDFEAALAEVESVVQQLESGDLGLSESLAQYERGIQKIKLCHQVLEQAENRISVLTAVDEDGTPSTEPVIAEEDADDALGQSGTARKPVRRARKSKNEGSPPPVGDVDDSEGLF